jgi:hypothetical protein
VHSALINNSVAPLGERIAETNQNHRRNPRHPEIPQLFKRIHVSSFPSVKLLCRDTGHFRQVLLGVVSVGVESGAELAQQLHKSLLSDH